MRKDLHTNKTEKQKKTKRKGLPCFNKEPTIVENQMSVRTQPENVETHNH